MVIPTFLPTQATRHYVASPTNAISMSTNSRAPYHQQQPQALDAMERRRRQQSMSAGYQQPRRVPNDEAASQRKRIPVACGRCRKRKIRCSGDDGSGKPCTNCQNAGVGHCLYLRMSSLDPHQLKENLYSKGMLADAARRGSNSPQPFRGPMADAASAGAAPSHPQMGYDAGALHHHQPAYGYLPSQAPTGRTNGYPGAAWGNPSPQEYCVAGDQQQQQQQQQQAYGHPHGLYMTPAGPSSRMDEGSTYDFSGPQQQQQAMAAGSSPWDRRGSGGTTPDSHSPAEGGSSRTSVSASSVYTSPSSGDGGYAAAGGYMAAAAAATAVSYHQPSPPVMAMAYPTTSSSGGLAGSVTSSGDRASPFPVLSPFVEPGMAGQSSLPPYSMPEMGE